MDDRLYYVYLSSRKRRQYRHIYSALSYKLKFKKKTVTEFCSVTDFFYIVGIIQFDHKMCTTVHLYNVVGR